MAAIQQIFKRYAPEYLSLYGDNLPANHRKVIDAIINCRTGELGAGLYQCEDCGLLHVALRSCGNRHCPTCQSEKSDLWLYDRMQQLLPCPYFLITFTVPQEIRAFIRRHQKLCYDAMFKAASGSLITLAKDKRFIGADTVGFSGVLHTWGRLIQYHPHIHFIVPGGGLSQNADKWRPSRQDFYIHIKTLSKMFKAKFKALIKAAGMLDKIDPIVWNKGFNVDSRPVDDGKSSLKYLAAYVFRVAISDSRIVCYDNHQVTFLYRKQKSKRWRRTTVNAIEFMRRFLQHTLPTGFMKIRHYGFLNANCNISIDQIRILIGGLYQIVKALSNPDSKPVSKPVICRHCGKTMQLLLFVTKPFKPPG